ncbi:unnamed protein product [Protopolystoma xenopodis]|uniref:Uncharacterized protein n=1 Tax=Protopolystoma xenopodis TaxID=117903 RepID=A0A448WPT0_9PLAT|nr:unnamed protein product [Protopolystoma xenopodis]
MPLDVAALLLATTCYTPTLSPRPNRLFVCPGCHGHVGACGQKERGRAMRWGHGLKGVARRLDASSTLSEWDNCSHSETASRRVECVQEGRKLGTISKQLVVSTLASIFSGLACFGLVQIKRQQRISATICGWPVCGNARKSNLFDT